MTRSMHDTGGEGEDGPLPVGLPVASPVPAMTPSAATLGLPPASGFAATKDPSPQRVRRPERRRGLGVAGLVGLNELLSERDVAVLEAVAAHRFLTTQHIELLLFHDHASQLSGSRSCRRVLARLETWRLLERPIRRIGGLSAGSASSVWTLSSAGQRLLSLRAGEGAVGRVREPGERFIAHYLAVADAHVGLVLAERAKQLELLQVQTEPACWRSYTGLGGNRQTLKPDLFAVSAPLGPDGAKADFEDHWFIEIDRATESLPTILKQCRLYEAYRRQGPELVDRGVFPLVLWVVPHQTRATKLQAALRSARGLDNGLFRVTTAESFVGAVVGGTA